MIDYNNLAAGFWEDYLSDLDTEWHVQYYSNEYEDEFDMERFQDAVEDIHPLRLLRDHLSILTASNITDYDLDWMREVVK